MRKLNTVLSLTFGLFLSSTALIACSGDGENESGKKVDGVNVTTGKKLKELKLIGDYEDKHSEHGFLNEGIITHVYNLEYDSKDRLIRIKGRNQRNPENDGTELLIDYDLRTMTFIRKYGPKDTNTYNYDFAINENGYISQLGVYNLRYNPKGYLVDVEGPEKIGSISYTENLVDASLLNLEYGKIALYYFTYDNNGNQGDLYFNIQCIGRYTYHAVSEYPVIFSLIAYQSGLFGKVVESIFNLKNRNEATSLVSYFDEFATYNIKMIFIRE